MKTIDNTSSLQAYQEAKLKVSKINDYLDKVERKNNNPEVIKDLVSSFLIPDVERKKVERECKSKNQSCSVLINIFCLFSTIQGA